MNFIKKKLCKLIGVIILFISIHVHASDYLYALRRVGATELHLAIATCHTLNLFVSRPDMDDLREIISKGIPVNATDNKGRTALHYAFAGGNNTLCNDYVYQLMELGADPDIKDSTGRNPYQTSNRGYRYLIFQ